MPAGCAATRRFPSSPVGNTPGSDAPIVMSSGVSPASSADVSCFFQRLCGTNPHFRHWADSCLKTPAGSPATGEAIPVPIGFPDRKATPSLLTSPLNPSPQPILHLTPPNMESYHRLWMPSLIKCQSYDSHQAFNSALTLSE